MWSTFSEDNLIQNNIAAVLDEQVIESLFNELVTSNHHLSQSVGHLAQNNVLIMENLNPSFPHWVGSGMDEHYQVAHVHCRSIIVPTSQSICQSSAVVDNCAIGTCLVTLLGMDHRTRKASFSVITILRKIANCIS